MRKKKSLNSNIVSHMDPKEIWYDIDAVISSGVSIDDILKIGEPYPLHFVDHYEKILDLGADPMWLFKHNEPWYAVRSEWAEELANTLEVYVEHGLSVEFAKSWLLDHICFEHVLPNAKAFKFFGINARDYIDEYLEHSQDSCICNIGSLPEPITPDDVVRHFSIKEIRACYESISGYRYRGFDAFVYEFAKVGGDIQFLAAKFLKEMGYPEKEEYLMALVLMRDKGAAEVDANKIIDSLTIRAYAYKDVESIKSVNLWFYDMLLDYADEAHLAKLKTAQPATR